MRIRRTTAYVGLLVGVILLIWSGFMRYTVHQPTTNGQSDSQQTTSVNGYSVVREAARDGLVRDEQGRLAKRLKRANADDKDDKTCYT